MHSCSFAIATGLQWVCLRAPHNCSAIPGKPCLPAPHWSLAPCWTPVTCICSLVRSGRWEAWGGERKRNGLREVRWQLDGQIHRGGRGEPQEGTGGRGRPGRWEASCSITGTSVLTPTSRQRPHPQKCPQAPVHTQPPALSRARTALYSAPAVCCLLQLASMLF